MHELGIVTAMLGEATREANMRAARRIVRLRCRVGVLRGIDAALLREAFAVARRGTPASDADLDVTTIALTCECSGCGGSGLVNEIRTDCPWCGRGPIRLRGGDELELDSIEIEVDDEDRSRSQEPVDQQRIGRRHESRPSG